MRSHANRFVLALSCVVAGCTVGPDYQSPELPQASDWRTPAGDALHAVDTAWWSGFEDSVLDALVIEAVRNNLDVRIAAARVDEFAARVGLTRSEAFPQVGYDAGAGRSQQSRETATAGGPRVADFFEANLNVGWELDIFGRIRRATDAAVADTLAAEEFRRGVILTIVTSVATSYIALLSLDEQLDISRQKLQTRQETLELFELQFSKGVVSQLEVAQIRSELERTAATIPALQRDIAQLENSLSVLLGRPPGPISRGSSIVTLGQPPIPAGLPSDLLRRRPDLREAEQTLVAANERIGEAVASFYPRFNLTAALGVASEEFTDLFQTSATTYSLAAGLAGPLFTAGFLESQLKIAEAQELQALESYRSAVLTALLESEDALVQRTTTLDEAQAQNRQLDALAQYARLAQTRYDNGYVGYLEVLDAERDLFDAELQQIQLRAAGYTAIISIYKAFGGGWVTIADQNAAASRASAAPAAVR